MAIEKDIAIHGSSGITQCIDYISDSEKSDTSKYPDNNASSDINQLLDYAGNLEKTVFALDGDQTILVTGINCHEKLAPRQFARTHQAYEREHENQGRRGSGGTKTIHDPKTGKTRTVAKESIEAYHVIQSFPQLEGLDPRLVHKLGLEYASAAFPEHQCVVSTHMNTDNLHNHIVVCAYKQDGSRKIAMNKAFRRQIRSINDEISLKYGLPIILGNEIGDNISMSTGEYYARTRGESFKEKVRSDITTALSKDYVSSWSDFIIKMQDLGYTIRETSKNVTYIKTDKDKSGKEIVHRVRENKLGFQYEKQQICRQKGWKVASATHLTYWERDRLSEVKASSSKNDFIGFNNKDEKFHIHISRYDDNGIRRTDLEMLFLIAINVIQYLWNRLIEKHEGKDIIPDADHDPRILVKNISDCMHLAKILNIGSFEDLNIRKNEVGKNISVNKKELGNAKTLADTYDKLSRKVAEYRNLSEELNKNGIHIDDFYLLTPTTSEISSSMARLLPMSPEQRRELFLITNKADSTWRLDSKYDDISYLTANDVFDFISGKTDKRPSCLLTLDEFNAKRERLRREASIGNPDKLSHDRQKDMLDASFEKLASSYSPEISVLITRCRNILQELSNLGYKPEDLSSLIRQSQEYTHSYHVLKDKASMLNSEYRNLCRLEEGIGIAKEHSFYEKITQDKRTENHQNSNINDSFDITTEYLDSLSRH